MVHYCFYRDERTTRHLDLVAEDAPPDIVTPDGAGLSLSEHCALLFAAVKAQQEEIEALKTRITKLENQ